MAALLILDRAPALQLLAPMRPTNVIIRDERGCDMIARERLLDDAFGPERFAKACQRLRDGRAPAHGLAHVASDGKGLVGTLRFWNIRASNCPALLLGPLAIAEAHRCQGIGGRLIRAGLDRARRLGHCAVLLVGDAPYYERFGFERRLTKRLAMPGHVDENRFLGLELVSGSLAEACGPVAAARSECRQTSASFRQAA
jgi:predicted N-acetyltransferase YhbS